MIAKVIARKIGRNPSSNGQLTKTALEGGGLIVRRLVTQSLELRPERFANGPSSGGTPTAYRGNFDTSIDNRAIEHHRRTLPPGFISYFCHDLQYETSGSLGQAPFFGLKSQK